MLVELHAHFISLTRPVRTRLPIRVGGQFPTSPHWATGWLKPFPITLVRGRALSELFIP